jgi:hypothetical protein
MEMEKPKETQTSVSPALASTAPQLSSVEDLERRLKLIGTAPPVADMKPASAPTAAVTPAATMGGKTALLVRFVM